MNCCASRVELAWLIGILDVLLCSVSAFDPCNIYTDLNDNTLTDHNSVPGSNRGYSKNGWYRVTSSTEGLLVRTCPTGNECGTASQVWMKDAIPTYSSGETMVKICIRNGNSCCDRSRTVRMKNCNTFVVYYLLRIPPTTGYCFETSSNDLQPVSTTSVPTSDSMTPQTAASSVLQTTRARLSTLPSSVSQSSSGTQPSLTKPMPTKQVQHETAVTTHLPMTKTPTAIQLASTIEATDRTDNLNMPQNDKDSYTKDHTNTSKVLIIASVSATVGVLCICIGPAAVIIRKIYRSKKKKISSLGGNTVDNQQNTTGVQRKTFDKRTLYETDYTLPA